MDTIDFDHKVRPIGALLLLANAGIHVFLAHEYAGVVVGDGTFNGNGFSQEFLFYAVGALMVGLAAALAFGGRRVRSFAWGFGGYVMAIALLALLAYRLGSPGEIGPIPDMSSSSWLPVGKPLSAVIDLVFVALSLGRQPVQRRRDRAGEQNEDRPIGS